MALFETLLTTAHHALQSLAEEDRRELYLTSIHAVGTPQGALTWHANYYHPLRDVLYTVDEQGTVSGPEETLQDVDFLPELDMNAVQVPPEVAEKTAVSVLDAKEVERIERKLLVLQMMDDDPIWNITFFLPDGRVVNVHVSARQGGIIRQDRFTLFSRA